MAFDESFDGGLESPERVVSVSLTPSELGFRGDILLRGENHGHFSLWKIDDTKVYLQDIQIGYDENAPRNKGYGLEAYKQIIQALRIQDIKLVSTDFKVSNSSLSPQALRVWEKLKECGYATQTGETVGKILDRFTGEEKVETIPVYESC